MPRATFGLDALTGATPGLSKLAQAFAGGNGAYQQGYEGELGNRSKIAQAMAAAAASQAKADQDNTETNIVRSRPDLIDENVALEAGTTLPLVRAFQQYTRTGVMPTRQLQGPADEAGNGPGIAPVLDDTGLQSKIAQAMRRSLPMRTNVKDTNVEDFAKAAGLYQGQDLTNDVLNGARTPGQVGAAQAAAGGKPLYHFDSSGLVGDLFGGGLNESSGRAQAVTGKDVALGKQATAGAVENYAQAENARASAAKSRQEIEQGVKSGMLKLDKDADGNIIVVDLQHRTIETPKDKDTGLPVKPAAKGANLSEGERKAATLLTRLRGSQSQLQQALLDDPSAAKPDSMAEMARMVPVIGGDTPANSIMSGGRQRVENAQLDMLDAALTLGTGAAYTKEQLRGYARSYFPQIGDDQATVADKQERLQSVIRAAEIAAGRAEPLAPKYPTPTAPSAPKPNVRTPMGAPPGQPQQAIPPNGRPPLSSFQR
jgi:hypothetical protein